MDSDPGKEPRKCTTNTDAVDWELEQLRARAQLLRKQAASASGADEEKLEEELRSTERELAMKDNDTYRRQHASVTQE